MTEEGGFLLQINVDAAEKNPLLADVGFIGANGRIGRDEQGVMSLGQELGHERIVVHATAAKHAGGARGDVGDTHR